MKIKEKILLDRDGLFEHGPINIVVLGDSVSHGAMNGYQDYENVYWNVLKKKLNAFRDYMPVNVINASIGGTCALEGLQRLEKQVLIHNPDLVIVCFGLNDVNGELEVYLNSLKQIFEKCQKSDVIFMTPNMLNTYVADDTPEEHRDYAFQTAEYQNCGKMDKFIFAAIELANKMGVTVCDCYSKWKELSKTQDTTMLLINRINHPSPEMHRLFAGVISAFVDNVATVLMVAPIALAICKKLNTNPVPFIIAIAVSSNLQGAATVPLSALRQILQVSVYYARKAMRLKTKISLK